MTSTHTNAAKLKFPGIFRSRETGAMWIANSPVVAVRITMATVPSGDNPGVIGDSITITSAQGQQINEAQYEQVTDDVSVTFHLP